MKTQFTPRYYQQDAVKAIWQALRDFDDNPCAELPTGAGKSWVLAQIAHDAATKWNGRVLILAHRKELLEQNFEKVAALIPDSISAGINSAGLKQRDTESQVIVAGIQSVYNKACKLGGFDVVVVDECHLLPPDGEGMYRVLIKDLKVLRPHVRVIGLTATPYRLKGGMVCKPDNILNRICYRVGIPDLIEKGFLCPIYSNEAHAKIDTSGLHIRAGEFIQAEADALWNDPHLVEKAVKEIIERTQDREKVLIFSQGIEHSEQVRKILCDLGHHCESVYGETNATDRADILGRFKNGQLKYLTNCDVLTTGFDAPNIDCVVMLRPTASAGLYYQMCGRGFRILPGKKNCLILDFAGNIERHGPVDLLSQKVAEKESGGTGESPVKTCPECSNVVGISIMECPECGHIWEPEQSPPHDEKPTDVPILSSHKPKRPTVTYSWNVVQDMDAVSHMKKGADIGHPHVLRVLYTLAWGDCSEWICLEHDGYARVKAREWWFTRTGSTDYPETVADAETRFEEIKWPEAVILKTEQGKKYPEVCQVVMDKDLDDEWNERDGWEPKCPACGKDVYPQLKKKQCLHCHEWYDVPAMAQSPVGEWATKPERESTEWDEAEVPF